MTQRTTRQFRVADDVWDAAQVRARFEQTTVSQIIRDAIAQYGRGGPVYIPGRVIPAHDEWDKVMRAVGDA